MNKPTIIIIIFVVLTALIAWQYLMPAFDKVSGLREELKTWQGKLDDTQSLGRKLEDLKKKYNAISEEVVRVNQAAPQKDDIPGLLVQLEQLTSQNGLILNNVSFAAPDVKKTKKTAVSSEESALPASSPAASARAGINTVTQKSAPPADVKILKVDLSLTGTLNSFRTFLSAIETNLRIMDVAAISFSGKGSSGDSKTESASQDFKISLNTYFR